MLRNGKNWVRPTKKNLLCIFLVLIPRIKDAMYCILSYDRSYQELQKGIFMRFRL